MTKLIALTFSVAIMLSACGGGGSSSSSGGNAAAAASCNQAPTLGATTFGNGCFK
ncbi:hypothetical protein ICN18_02115 [Polynucleobacter sp. Ross1-W9]|uniref:hypothetical protein n=1 Tax=Polynucleobacter parvulilacunae TaxID=1855631 RepID=UPI001C0C6D1E|nr:hypothetical protein [Polynucleobacter parvulilacunae]MBU3556422.1 hypothetical protein [Polynucleobacter parvulilacunae]